MNKRIAVKLSAEVVFLTGVVNGEETVWQKDLGDVWVAEVPRSTDSYYHIQVRAYDELGQCSDVETTLQCGIAAKTDWTDGDYYNHWDLNRVERASRFLYDLLLEYGYWAVEFRAMMALAASQIGTKNTSQYNLAYYGTSKDPGYAWCVVFLWWLFRQTGMAGLFYGGGKTASSNTLYNYHKGRGQAVTDYQPGDIIFFDTTGKRSSINHVGICESYNGTTMVSIVLEAMVVMHRMLKGG